MAADFSIFGVVGFVGFVVSVLLLCWMRTAILAGGIAVVRSCFCSVSFFPKMVKCYVLCSTATGLLGRTALGAKKKLQDSVLDPRVMSPSDVQQALKPRRVSQL